MALKLCKVAPKKSLNAAFLKVRPLRSEIDLFKANLITLIDKINESESEENQKNHVRDFLLNTYYSGKNEVNTKGRQDLVIHTDAHNTSSVGVILETKRPTNKAEWISPDKPNNKALHELVLYYLRERVDAKNIDVKYLVATNVYEWYIFDAAYFDKLFYQNKKFVRDYEDWRDGKKVLRDTSLFYNEIAKTFIDNLDDEIPCTFFDLREYENELRNADKADDKKLIALQKLLSPFHLLRHSFANDSNSLDKRFYSELLHIIGLTETKEGGKKLIGRHKAGERHSGSILEDTIIQIDSLDKLSRVDRPGQYGADKEERLFSIALELSITWINRILFLKLLEGQLVSYHNRSAEYLFLNKKVIREYDDLNSLFFQVLAKQNNERNDDVRNTFARVPYLNSSLFEPTELEHSTIFISNLKDEKTIPLHASTMLKDSTGKKRTGQLSTLEYLFEFLNAYDFSSEGSEDIQEDNKTLINASVLGLIFEKINGYKDGSFFTPGFITMYMCRETIRRAVVQKFNETKSWSCKDITELYNKIDDRTEANTIVNSLRICDPAVGSGHFLVSALNEMIAVKGELGILQDAGHKRLKEYTVEVINDELIIKDENGDLFSYNPKNAESQRVQKTLFHEKQTLIENCLFGVDINPNSVKICRLRLWIELLKNAYYKKENELETLPNIDINIKCGNSLVSRFGLDADIRAALKKSKWTIDSYRLTVSAYRNAENKEEKREMERLINDIKSDFRSEIGKNDPLILKRSKLQGELFNLSQETLFGRTEKEQVEVDKKINKLQGDITKIEDEIESIKANKIYENAFEWRFEFPEVLNEEGDFVGFDVVIGNPPYISLTNIKQDSNSLSNLNYLTFNKNGDIYTLFCERGNSILKENGYLSLIIPNKWLNASYGKELRTYLNEYTNPTKIIDFEGVLVFDEAVVFVCILEFQKSEFQNIIKGIKINSVNDVLNRLYRFSEFASSIDGSTNASWKIADATIINLNNKIKAKGTLLKDWPGICFFRGVTTGFNDAFHITAEKRQIIISQDKCSADLIHPLLRGKDIKRYKIDDPNLFLIFTRRETINIDDFPGIKQHLEQFKLDLIPKKNETDLRGRKPGTYKWFEIQDNTAYYNEFHNDKIIWIEISDKANFTLDNEGHFLTNSAYFISGKNLKYLLAVLNSKLCDYYFFQNTAVIAGGRKRYTKQYVEQNPIPIISEEEQKPFIDLIEKILQEKKELSMDTTELEAEIDRMVYDLYGLTEEERKIVEGE